MILIERISGPIWVENFSENAHLATFGQVKPKEWDRIDFALLGVVDGTPMGYMTCREFSHDTVYWQYGGSIPNVSRGTIWAFRLYEAFLAWHKERYKRCVTYIENTNSAMLRMAAKIGFIITGIRNYHGDVLLEHLLEF